MMALGIHSRIAIGWTVVTVAGISAFALSKKSIDKRRYESMRIRERMKRSNEGEYEPSHRRFDA